MNSGSRGVLMAEASMTTASAANTPRTRVESRTYRNPSTSVRPGESDRAPGGTGGRLTPDTRRADAPNDAAFSPNAGPTPRWVTRTPPRMGPAITAMWKVVETTAFAATRLSGGTRFGSDAWKLGWNSA